MPTSVLVADDHQIVRQGLKVLLESENFDVVGEASDGHEATVLTEKLRPDVAVLDFMMPRLNGLDAAVQSVLGIGPSNRALEGQPAEIRAAAVQSIREMLTPLAKGNTVPLAGSIWIVTARTS